MPAKTVVVVQAVFCREEMTQRLIHQGPGISFQLGYSLQMWRLRAVTLPPRSLCSDLLSRVGNLNTGVHLGLSPSAALPLLNRAGSWLIPLLLGCHEKRLSSFVSALGTTEGWQAAAEGQLCLVPSSCVWEATITSTPVTHWAPAGTSCAGGHVPSSLLHPLEAPGCPWLPCHA